MNRPSETSGEASANGALGGRRPVRVDPHSLVPPSQQLVAAVLDAIARGDLGPGDKLPSVRGLAAEALVNPNTVGKAFRDLEHLGATEGRNGSGVFVTAAGPDVARAIRLAETLATFREAALAAVRAGHDGSVLQAALGAAQAEEGKAKGAGNWEDAALAARSRR